MAKKAMIEREKKRQRLVEKYAAKRAQLKEIAKLPRNSAANRMHNRCQLTGRPHAYYRKLKISRIALRELGSAGQLPGMVKSSW
jgi:small subunit ribosomal protein S14